ncbi:hypothetical protein POVCU1_032420 [Plasmodium ovale curtisi]|uniref:Uncharacterized protein n=1 Tax=Plasmodium ovale curtisi TaxID=864141 RepID=A0A1A8WTY2_PLAOA|nr:hypothetical protein POVCU1_032420 [Plasmodium ovale curtisi]
MNRDDISSNGKQTKWEEKKKKKKEGELGHYNETQCINEIFRWGLDVHTYPSTEQNGYNLQPFYIPICPLLPERYLQGREDGGSKRRAG